MAAFTSSASLNSRAVSMSVWYSVSVAVWTIRSRPTEALEPRRLKVEVDVAADLGLGAAPTVELPCAVEEPKEDELLICCSRSDPTMLCSH